METRLLWAVILLSLVCILSQSQTVTTEYIVVLKPGASIADVNGASNATSVRQINSAPVYLVAIAGDDKNGNTLKKFQQDKSVDSAEYNVQIRLNSNPPAALDPSLVQQMASLLDGYTVTNFYGTTVLQSYANQAALAITHVNDVRNISTGAGTHIAFIDTGADFYHPAIAPWLDPGADVLFNSSASELDGLSQQMASLLDQQMASRLLDQRFSFMLDQSMASLLDGGNSLGNFPPDFGHGTLVAGVLHVVAPGARLVPIKAFDAYGNTTAYSIVQAVYRARDMGVDVLNMSFSTTQYSTTLRKALIDAHAAGVAIVASSGNDATNTSYYPAAYPNVIGVAATDFSDKLASFSNYGSAVSVAAPGAFVVSTVPGGRYAAAWGTSFSAPMVSGELALLASARGHGNSGPSIAVNTADAIDSVNPGLSGQLGKGRINAQRALTKGN